MQNLKRRDVMGVLKELKTLCLKEVINSKLRS